MKITAVATAVDMPVSRVQRNGMTRMRSPYALEELHSNEDENGSNVVRSNPTGHNATATFYQSGSEEMILNNRDSNNVPQGILMTIEFNVH